MGDAMQRSAKSPIALFITLGLALAGSVGLPSVAGATIPLSMAGLASLDTPGLYDLSTANTTEVVVAVNGVAVTGTTTTTRLAISGNVTLTLVNAHITGPLAGTYSPISADFCYASCGLVLIGANSLTATGNGAGLKIETGRSLVIEGPGSLSATGAGGAAGIGGNRGESSGTVTIQHAVVVANGSAYDGGAAGIGGGGGASGAGGSNGLLTIINSAVTATGAAGIGLGGGGAGIGGGGGTNGPGGLGSHITITASVVIANGGAGGSAGSAGGGAGIGGGGACGDLAVGGGSALNVSIDDASVVKAVGGAGGPGLGVLGGGGGAAIGGGGGPDPAGDAIDLSVAGAKLAQDSAPGHYGPSPSGSGADGALCGTGGISRTSTTPGAEVPVDGTQNCSIDPALVADLSSRPNPAYSGHPTAPDFTNPLDTTAMVNSNTSFTVAPQSGSYLFQWQLSTDNGATWNDLAPSGVYAGTTTDTLTLTAVTMAMGGQHYRCLVGNAVAQDVQSSAATLTVLTPVTVSATEVGGTSGTVDSTDIQLTFSEPVMGLDLADITVTPDTGAVNVGASLADASGDGTVWLLALSGVVTEGDVEVAIADFAGFTVTNSPLTVAVYKDTALTFTDPADVTILAGESASFFVVPHTWATAFQWEQSTDNGTTWNPVFDDGVLYSGASTDTLGLAGVPLSMNAYQYRCQISDFWANPQPSGMAVLTVERIPVTFTATQVGGVSGKADSTGIELTFSTPVTGLMATDITVAAGSGQVTVGSLRDISGTGEVWLLELTSVLAEGDVAITISDFDIRRVTTPPHAVTVFKLVPAPNFKVGLKQAKGGTATVSPANAPAGTTVVLTATPDKGYEFAGWQTSTAVTWVRGDANSASASFTMPQGGVTVTPLFVLAKVNPPPPPIKPPVIKPPVQPPNQPVPPPAAPKPAPKVPLTGDPQGANAAGLALLASLLGIYTLALRRKHQPSRPAPRHLAV